MEFTGGEISCLMYSRLSALPKFVTLLVTDMIKEAQIALCVGHIKEQYVCSLMTAFCSLIFLFKLEFKTAKSFETDTRLITM